MTLFRIEAVASIMIITITRTITRVSQPLNDSFPP